jgi:hypothetical protein
MKYHRVLFIATLAVITITVIGCDSSSPLEANNSGLEGESPHLTADDYYNTLKTLDSLSVADRSATKAGSDRAGANSQESALVKLARERGGDPDGVKEYLARYGESKVRQSPDETLRASLGMMPESQREYIAGMVSAIKGETSLPAIEQNVSDWVKRAESDLSGTDLRVVKEAAAYIVGTARYWTETRGMSLRSMGDSQSSLNTGLKDLDSKMAMECNDAPQEQNYTNYWAQLNQGFMSFAQACALTGGAAFAVGGPWTGAAGCAIGGIPASVVGYWAIQEQQQDNYLQAVRAWCDECRFETWQASMFCAEELPEL